MFVNFSEEVRHILKNAEKERDDLNHPYVGSEHLFLSILKNSKLKDILKKHKVTYDKFKEKLISLVGVGSKKSKFVLYTPLLKRVLENAVIEAREENNKVVNPEIIIISILDEEDGIAYTILKSFNVNIDKLYYDLNCKYFGPDMVSDSEIAYEWARIPHFYYNFYVYQYATGFSSAVALAHGILKEGASAVERYKKFLSGGCSASPVELLKIAGVNLETPKPIQEALDVFGEVLDEIEALLA